MQFIEAGHSSVLLAVVVQHHAPCSTSHSHAADRAALPGLEYYLYRSGMRGDENRVIDAYVTWLERRGWTVRREVDLVDVYAERGDERLYAEAKGRTTSPGLDVDTLYGQLLRRMKDPKPGARYSVVVPTSALNAALRVPDWVRGCLSIDVYEVDDAGGVHRHS